MSETVPGHAELVEEGLGILTNLMDNIQRKGNYSAESTIVFLDQIGQCLRAALRPEEAAGQGEADENDGLEHCGNFSATDPITDEDRIAYWKGAYERMAARNVALCVAGKAIFGHMPEFYPDKAWKHFEEMLATGGMTR